MTATAAPVPTELPPGYAAERERDATVVALPSVIHAVMRAVRQAGSLYRWAAAQPDARALAGRGAAFAVRGDDGDWVVRHYRRGGMAASVLEDSYLKLGEPRPLVELRASVAARARGVRTPEVVAAVIHDGRALYRADLATRLVPDAADLADTVLGGEGGGGHGGGHAARVAAWRAAGELLHDAFAHGVVHADLNMRNILVQRGAVRRAHLLDLDRAVVRDGPVSDAARRRMLNRLHRSRRKLEAALGAEASADELQAFSAAVAGA